jgi:hypothetical protein
MKKRILFTLSVVALATALLSAPASATPANSVGAKGQWPEAEYGGEVWIWGHTYGYAFFDDYDGDTDRDNFYIVDEPGDGKSVSLWITHKDVVYGAHAYYGETKKIDVGNIKNGTTVKLEACGWDDGDVIDCVENEITE